MLTFCKRRVLTGTLKQTLLAMRITTAILLVGTLHVAAKGVSQTITLSGKDIPIKTVFAEIKKQCGYVVAYNEELISNARPITIQVTNEPLFEFLDNTLHVRQLDYVVQNKTIIIQRSNLKSPEVETTRPLNEVKGRIVNENGEPLPGVSIFIKGTRKGTITNAKGEFVLKNIDEGAVLIISATNIETRELKLNGGNEFASITVRIKVGELEEVVVNKGYYTERQKVSTSNVAIVKAADIEKQPVQNPLLALQARVPGLVVTQPSGLSGTGVKVRIQGQNSINNGNEPLFVVDGVPIDAKLSNTGNENAVFTREGGYGSPLNYINPLDIGSIEVLKDADATAIYGSRAANGAILITTKKGKPGVMKLDVNMQTGWGKMTRRVEMMNTRQYLDMRYEAFRNDNINWREPSFSADDLKVWDTTSYTNWQDELLGGTSRYSDMNAAVSGGSSTLRYLVSGTYHRESTIFPFPDFNDQKAAVHFNLNANNNDQKFRIQLSGNYLFDNNKLPRQDLTQSALLNEPNAPPLLNAAAASTGRRMLMEILQQAEIMSVMS